MKVYVEKLPEDCFECPFFKDIKLNGGMDRMIYCVANKNKIIRNPYKSFKKCLLRQKFEALGERK